MVSNAESTGKNPTMNLAGNLFGRNGLFLCLSGSSAFSGNGGALSYSVFNQLGLAKANMSLKSFATLTRTLRSAAAPRRLALRYGAIGVI